MGVANFLAQEGGYQSGGEFTPSVVRCRLRAPYSCPHRHEPKEEFSCELEMSACGQVRLTGLLFGILLGVCVQEIN